MIAKIEALGDRLLALLVPRVRASATVLDCAKHYVDLWCWTTDPDDAKRCYRICCDNVGHPPSCGSVICPC